MYWPFISTIAQRGVPSSFIKIEPFIFTQPAENISGKWRYSSPLNDINYEIWIILQSGNKVIIKDEDDQISFNGQYLYSLGNFSYIRSIPLTNNNSIIEEGIGRIDSTGNKIKGIVKSRGFSDNFILERISE